VSRVRAQVDIDAPVEKVFAFFDDPANAELLVPSFWAVLSVEELPNGGRRTEYTTRNKRGDLVDATSEHLDYDPPHSTVTRGEQSGIATTSTRRFEARATGTRIDATIEWSAPVKYLSSLVGSPLRGPLKRSLRYSLRAAKDALESAHQ